MPTLETEIDALGNAALRVKAERDALRKALGAALGYMRNAQIDLETGAPKATAIRTLSGGIALAEAAMSEAA